MRIPWAVKLKGLAKKQLCIPVMVLSNDVPLLAPRAFRILAETNNLAYGDPYEGVVEFQVTPQRHTLRVEACCLSMAVYVLAVQGPHLEREQSAPFFKDVVIT